MGDVRLDRVLADHQLRRDLRVGQPAGDQPQHLELARRQLGQRGRHAAGLGAGGVGEALDQPAGDRRREQRVPGRRHAHGVEQAVGRRVLEQEAARPDPQRLVDVLVEVEGREHQRPRSRAPGRRGSASPALRPSSSGMRMSISTTSGRCRRTTSTRGATVAGLPDHPDVGLGVEDHAEAGAQQAAGRRRSTTLISRGGAALGAASLVRPPRASAPRATADPLGDARQPQRARRLHQLGDRGPAIWRTTSEARISPPAGGLAEAAGDDHRRAVEVVAVGERLAGVEPDAQLGAPRSAPVVARCMSTAHRTAATALGNATIRPSPVDLTSRPPCSAIASPQGVEVLAADGVRRLVAEAVEQRRRSRRGR